jgi:hypothetical protein
VFLGDSRVEDEKERDERKEMGNHHEKMGLKRISCASQCTMLDMAGTSPDPAGNFTNTRSSKPNQASCTPDFSYPLVSSILFPSPSPISLSRPQLYHHG